MGLVKTQPNVPDDMMLFYFTYPDSTFNGYGIAYSWIEAVSIYGSCDMTKVELIDDK